jgi:hypothetical protein
MKMELRHRSAQIQKSGKCFDALHEVLTDGAHLLGKTKGHLSLADKAS